MIFTPRYNPTASPSHVTWENSILVKKLIREVDIQLLHDSSFYSDVKLSFEIKNNDLKRPFGVISHFKRIIKSIWDFQELETWSNDAHFGLFANFFWNSGNDPKWPQGSKKICLTSDSERSINTLSTLQVTSYNSERGDPYPAAPGMLVISDDS